MVGSQRDDRRGAKITLTDEFFTTPPRDKDTEIAKVVKEVVDSEAAEGSNSSDGLKIKLSVALGVGLLLAVVWFVLG